MTQMEQAELDDAFWSAKMNIIAGAALALAWQIVDILPYKLEDKRAQMQAVTCLKMVRQITNIADYGLPPSEDERRDQEIDEAIDYLLHTRKEEI